MAFEPSRKKSSIESIGIINRTANHSSFNPQWQKVLKNLKMLAQFCAAKFTAEEMNFLHNENLQAKYCFIRFWRDSAQQFKEEVKSRNNPKQSQKCKE